MKRTCATCFSRYTVDPDEDGYPGELPGDNCADNECGKRLCPTCLEHFSFACDGCGHQYCNEHLHLVPDGTDRPLRLCAACKVEADGFLKPIPHLGPISVRPVVPNVPEWGEVA